MATISQKDLRYARRFRIKTYLLHFLFPIRIIICLVLIIISYDHYMKLKSENDKNVEKDVNIPNDIDITGKLLSIVLFGVVIMLLNLFGWLGVFKRSWSLACAFNAASALILFIDLYMTIFDIPFHLIALIVTILILILNIFLALDLNSIQKQQDLIRRARIEEADRRKRQLQLQKQMEQYNKNMEMQE